MAVATDLCITPEEYLEREQADPWKNEYRDGRMIAMPHESARHNTLVMNIARTLVNQLQRSEWAVLSLRMRIKVEPTGLYTYPDVVIAPRHGRTEDEKEETLLDPVAIVEILSDATEAYDRGEKFRHYRQLPSLREYVMVSQRMTLVEHFERHSDGVWYLDDAYRPEQSVHFDTVGCELRVADVYEKVDLNAEGVPL